MRSSCFAVALLSLLLASGAAGQGAPLGNLLTKANSLQSWMVGVRRRLHQVGGAWGCGADMVGVVTLEGGSHRPWEALELTECPACIIVYHGSPSAGRRRQAGRQHPPLALALPSHTSGFLLPYPAPCRLCLW